MHDSNVRVIHSCQGQGFIAKTMPRGLVDQNAWAKDLDGDVALKAAVAGPVHLTHSSSAQPLLNFVGTQLHSRLQAHRCNSISEQKFGPVETQAASIWYATNRSEPRATTVIGLLEICS